VKDSVLKTCKGFALDPPPFKKSGPKLYDYLFSGVSVSSHLQTTIYLLIYVTIIGNTNGNIHSQKNTPKP
ncbi:MAG: hypothetical protein UD936_11350, partial [Acutalibacteraceae bacterium]|nr:hypothetical protein [Acutalibacteraceae bacterium]